jgi:hypothetical protein
LLIVNIMRIIYSWSNHYKLLEITKQKIHLLLISLISKSINKIIHWLDFQKVAIKIKVIIFISYIINKKLINI